jgi:hypothetical protein
MFQTPIFIIFSLLTITHAQPQYSSAVYRSQLSAQFAAPILIPKARATPLALPQQKASNGRAFGYQTQGAVAPVASVASQSSSACSGSSCVTGGKK